MTSNDRLRDVEALLRQLDVLMAENQERAAQARQQLADQRQRWAAYRQTIPTVQSWEEFETARRVLAEIFSEFSR